MQIPSSSLIISTSQHSTSMEAGNHLSCGSFSCSFRLSFDAESFIEFDPKRMSMRRGIKDADEVLSEHSSLELDSVLVPPRSLDSTKSQFSQTIRHQPLPVSSDSIRSRHHKSSLNHFWFLLQKLCRKMRGMRMTKRIKNKLSLKTASMERGRGKRVFDADTASSIQDAVLHCKNSNLSSLMMEEDSKA